MASDSSKPVITEMPIILEPPFPIFAPRPLKENLNKQTANVLFVNTSPFKLIFKIVPHSTTVIYAIRPEIDYLPPRGSRFVAISISEAPQPKKEHDFTYKVIALNTGEGFGVTATKYWEENGLENDEHRLQEAQFICVEPEKESKHPAVERHLIPTMEDANNVRTPSGDYAQRIRRQTIANDKASIEMQAPPAISPFYHRKPSRSKTASSISQTDGQCRCLCADPNRYFWNDATAMRSFCYGLAIALTLMGVIIARKN